MIGGLQRTSCYLLAGAAALGVLVSGVPAVHAQGLTEAQYQRLKRELKEELAAESDVDLKVKWKGAPQLSSRDGKFGFKVRGRIMADFDSIDQDYEASGFDDVNGVELRRARIGVEGWMFYDWKYKFEMDFADNEAEIKDAYIAWANWWSDIELSEIRGGQYYIYNSIEGVTSSRFITFMERAAYINAFGFNDRRIGAGVLVGDEHWSFQSGVYGAGTDQLFEETYDDQPLEAAVRATVAPINNDTTVVHLGGSYRHTNQGTIDGGEGSRGTVELARYRARAADLHLADRIISTPRFGQSSDAFNLEGALVWNSFSLQGEYGGINVDGASGVAPMIDPDYTGYYIEVSWFLTGEMRNYKAKTGEFGRTKVKNPLWGGSGGWGAVQIAGRYDVIELGDDATLLTNAGLDCDRCGNQKTWLLGINWLMTSHTALKFNYTNSDIDGIMWDGRRTSPQVHGFGMRFQTDW